MNKRISSLLSAVLVLAMLVPGSAVQGIALPDSGAEAVPAVYLPAMMKKYTYHIPTVIPEWTKPLTEATTQYLASVSPDELVYTFSQNTAELDAVQAGDIIAGVPAAAAPDGFLRRVLSKEVGSGQVILVTQQATIEEAIQTGEVSVKMHLTPAMVRSSSLAEGVTMTPSPDGLGFDYTLEGLVLYDPDGIPDSEDEITADGSLHVEPDLLFNLEVIDFSLHELSMLITMTENADLSVWSGIQATYQQEVELAQYNLTTILLWFGWVPVTFTPVVTLYAGFDGSITAGVEMALAQEASYVAGLKYQWGEWQIINELQNEFTRVPVPTLNLALDAKAYSGIQLSLMLYGSVGPHVRGQANIRLHANLQENPWWVLYGGLEVPVGFEVEVLGYDIAEKQVVAIQYEIELLNANLNSPPDPPTNPSPVDEATGVPIHPVLHWTATDPDGDTVTYDTYLAAGDPTPDVEVCHYGGAPSCDPGTLAYDTVYYWKVVVTDEYDAETTGPVWSFKTATGGSLPGAFSKVSPADGATNQPLGVIIDWGDSSGATEYQYCYGTSNDDACVNWTPADEGSQATLNWLSYSTTYYWQVRAMNANGFTYANGIISDYWSFTTGAGSVNPGEMVTIPAGEFQMGCDPNHNIGYACEAKELPLHTVYLDAYKIDVTEVTNAQYAECVAAGVCAPPFSNISYSGRNYYGNPEYADYPVIYMTWEQAGTYCAWAGKRLPTEAEWEKTARGTSPRSYRWGDWSPDCILANFGGINGCTGDTDEAGFHPTGVSVFGAMDMAGNVWEWVSDWYDASYYSISPYSNPQGPATGDYHIIRGGSWLNTSGYLRTACRMPSTPGPHNFYNVGFRCAMSAGDQ